MEQETAMIKTVNCPDAPACTGKIQIDDARNGPAPCPRCGTRWFNRKGVMQAPAGKSTGGGAQFGDFTFGDFAGRDQISINNSGPEGPDVRVRTGGEKQSGGFSIKITTGGNDRETKIRTLMQLLNLTREQAEKAVDQQGK